MNLFVDKTGQSWDVELTIGIARKVFDISKPDSVSKLLDDPYARFDLLWLICERQAKERGVSQDDFDSLLACEDAYHQANNALLGSVQDFFHRLGKTSLSTLMKKSGKLQRRWIGLQPRR